MRGDTRDCVGGVVRDDRSRLLLVRRGTEPGKGRWSIPGGRVEAGEDDATATAREVLEETGLRVDVGALLGSVTRPAPDGGWFLVRDYVCTPAYGADVAAVRAGDDAADVGWFAPGEMRALDCVDGLVEALEEWSVL